jgi:dehydrogenase/reductase SDR family protein 12
LSGLEIERCDFTSMRETRELADRLSSRGRRIDVLMNNVGVMNDTLVVTPENLEASFASNLLAHYVLTEGLIERGALGRDSVVVNITSGGAYSVPLSTALLNITNPAQFNGVVAYAAHKRAQIALTSFWRERHRETGVEFYVMHPGWADTAGVQRSLPRFRRLFKPVLRDARSGADTALWLAAERPSQPSQELIWFDRKIRAAHAFAYTRASPETPTDLANYLASISRSSVRDDK